MQDALLQGREFIRLPFEFQPWNTCTLACSTTTNNASKTKLWRSFKRELFRLKWVGHTTRQLTPPKENPRLVGDRLVSSYTSDFKFPILILNLPQDRNLSVIWYLGLGNFTLASVKISNSPGSVPFVCPHQNISLCSTYFNNLVRIGSPVGYFNGLTLVYPQNSISLENHQAWLTLRCTIIEKRIGTWKWDKRNCRHTSLVEKTYFLLIANPHSPPFQCWNMLQGHCHKVTILKRGKWELEIGKLTCSTKQFFRFSVNYFCPWFRLPAIKFLKKVQ